SAQPEILQGEEVAGAQRADVTVVGLRVDRVGLGELAVAVADDRAQRARVGTIEARARVLEADLPRLVRHGLGARRQARRAQRLREVEQCSEATAALGVSVPEQGRGTLEKRRPALQI